MDLAGDPALLDAHVVNVVVDGTVHHRLVHAAGDKPRRIRLYKIVEETFFHDSSDKCSIVA